MSMWQWESTRRAGAGVVIVIENEVRVSIRILAVSGVRSLPKATEPAEPAGARLHRRPGIGENGFS
jgi:hypothetical protein